MVNTEEFIKKLEQILDYYGLTASAFADKINVQRSSLSHLLSGRNKPSLEFVMKIVEEFSDVTLEWILYGKGSFPKEEISTPAFNKVEQKKESDRMEDLFSNSFEEKNNAIESSNIQTISQNSKTSEIERIVVFYKNGTFKNYVE